MTSTMHEPPVDVSRSASPSKRPRSKLPRFGLRTLLVIGIACSLLFGWIGRGYYRVRQEDAALETLLQAGGAAAFSQGRPVRDRSDLPFAGRAADLFLRSVGLAKRAKIESITLRIEDRNDAAAAKTLEALTALPEIESVCLIGEAFDDAAVDALGQLTRLKHLQLWRTRITGAGLSKFDHPERIESLNFAEQDPKTRLLSAIGVFERLRSLECAATPLLREDAVAIASLADLESLDISQDAAQEPGVYLPLASHPKLSHLFARAAALDRADVAAIIRVPRLETLWITGITDDDLPLFAEAPNLRDLWLFDPISPAAARRLSEQRPELKITLISALGTDLEFRAGEAAPRPFDR